MLGRKRLLTGMAFLCAFFIAGGVGASDADPVGATRNFIEAMFRYDPGAAEYVIGQHRERIASLLEELRNAGQDMDGIKVDTSQLNYEVVERDETTAKVHVHGRIKGTHPEYGESVDLMDEVFPLVKENGRWLVADPNL